MASILRSSKFIRYFATLARNIVISQPRGIDSTLINRSQLLALSGRNDFVTVASTMPDSRNNIDQSIKRLDQDVRKVGRIALKDLHDVIEEIRSCNQATSTQCLMIIRCCGNLIPEETPEVRTKLVKEVWKIFENLGVALDISHYNALLGVYLENEHVFSPGQMLEELEKRGIEPNRVTYQRLVAAYCQRGDVSSATTLLEIMRRNQTPINQAIFNSLIMGHAIAKDMESAEGIVGVMKDAKVEANEDTYTALASGYARLGDPEGLERVLSNLPNDLVLSDRALLQVAYTAAVNSQMEIFEQILSKLKKGVGFNQEAKTTVLRLIAQGEDAAAVKLLKAMHPLTGPKGEALPIGNFLLKQMVKSRRPVETILQLCDELERSKENERALAVATEASLQHGNPETSLLLLSALSKKEPVCQHYYWPIIIQYGRAQDHTGLMKTLRELSECVGAPASGETLRDYVMQFLPEGEEAIRMLRHAGVSAASAALAAVSDLLVNKKLKEAAALGLQYRANYNFRTFRRLLVLAYLAHPEDIESLITLVQLLEDKPATGGLNEESPEDSESPAGLVLLHIASTLQTERVSLLTRIMQKYLETGLGISKQTAELLNERLTEEEMTGEIPDLLQKLSSPDLIPAALNRPAIPRLTSIKDEETLLRTIAAQEAKGEPTNNLRRQLLTFYCHNRDLEKAIELKKELDAAGFELQSGMLSLLMDLHVHHELLEDALHYYAKVFEVDREAAVDDTKLLRLAILLVKNDRVDEAVAVLGKRKEREGLAETGYGYANLCWKLLNTAAEKKDASTVNMIFEVMIQHKYTEPSNMILGPLIKVHLLNENLKDALDKFEECCTKYKATPWKNEIACKLIEMEDAVSLQRLTDLSSQVHGEVNSLYDLVLSFIECGRIRQARKILETPGLRPRAHRIQAACDRYVSEGQTQYLENVVEATKDIPHLDRMPIYYNLLISYCNTDEVDKALGLWTQMQEEDVPASDDFMHKLGKLLEKHGRPVPFAVPTPSPPPIAASKPNITENINKRLFKSTESAHLRSLKQAIMLKNVDEALEIKQKMKDSDLRPMDMSGLLNLLVHAGRLGEASRMAETWLQAGLRPNFRALNLLINSIAKMGDIDSLRSIASHLDEDMKKEVSYCNREAHCLVEAGRTEELLESLEVKIDEAKTPAEITKLVNEFPRGGIFAIFESAPQHIPRFEAIARKFLSKGIFDPLNILWVHYTMKGDKAKSDEAWEGLKKVPRLMFRPILHKARVNSDLPMVEALSTRLASSQVPSVARGLVHSTIIDIALKVGDLKKAEEKLDLALKDVTLEEMNASTLRRLKSQVEATGRSFEYTIPPKGSRIQESSTSSDSDSESQETKKSRPSSTL